MKNILNIACLANGKYNYWPKNYTHLIISYVLLIFILLVILVRKIYFTDNYIFYLNLFKPIHKNFNYFFFRFDL